MKGWYSGTSLELEEDSEEDFSEAYAPVPDRLLPKRRSQALLIRMKLSQKLGCLMWMNREKLISKGGERRLLYLQRKASFEALSAGLNFSERLSNEKKLQLDFYPHMVELNRRPQSKRFRKQEKNRIGIGYRDKGTLPGNSSSGRSQAQKEAWIQSSDLPENLLLILQSTVPQLFEGEWLDLAGLSTHFNELNELRDQLLLNQL
jgi:hypothetical protein